MRRGGTALRELGLPAVAGVLAAGAGLALTRKRQVRNVAPDVKGGVGDLVDDLRGKLDAVIGKRGSAEDGDQPHRRSNGFSADELAERRQARRRRRDERRGGTEQ